MRSRSKGKTIKQKLWIFYKYLKGTGLFINLKIVRIVFLRAVHKKVGGMANKMKVKS